MATSKKAHSSSSGEHPLSKSKAHTREQSHDDETQSADPEHARLNQQAREQAASVKLPHFATLPADHPDVEMMGTRLVDEAKRQQAETQAALDREAATRPTAPETSRTTASGTAIDGVQRPRVTTQTLTPRSQRRP